MILRLLLLTVLAAGCTAEAEPEEGSSGTVRPPGWLHPVLETRLQEHAADGLPEQPALPIREMIDLLDGVNAGGRVGRMAERELDSLDPRQLAADLLAVVEDREASAPQRVLAYDRLSRTPVPAILPRLVLRLKYEKDWFANTFLAAALLEQGCGAGLDALRAVLATEDADPQARAAAAAVLGGLPGLAPDADFEAGWRRLLVLQQEWELERRLEGGAESVDDRDLRAEVWRLIARLRSQPLRPVDDARFALRRMRCGIVVPLLLEASRDQSLYVREGALQTLGWIGYPVGAWAKRTGFDYLGHFRSALLDAAARLRVLEALGAAGFTEAGPMILPWLRDGTFEERSAAADALLRCAGVDCVTEVSAALADRILGPEARYSLELLRAALDPTAPAASPPEGLAAGERQRRDRWAEQRARRP
ncbi:MAG: hypothetical protein H8E31_03030 [Planctomycetes bacterium]|nr:hypothetical protein [Planctomycetota bacterium]